MATRSPPNPGGGSLPPGWFTLDGGTLPSSELPRRLNLVLDVGILKSFLVFFVLFIVFYVVVFLYHVIAYVGNFYVGGVGLC